MGLKATRKILSIILCVVVAIATICTVSSAVLEMTFSSRGFITKNIVTSEVITECETQLKAKYAVLEDESGIPARVFETILSNYDTEESVKLAVENIFGEESSELYSEERVEYFYNLCVEYLDGNAIRYKKSEVQSVADRAAMIYSETVGVHNTGSVVDHLNMFRNNCTKSTSVGLISIVLCMVLLLVVYRDREFAVSYFVAGITAGGIATVLGAIICLIFKVSAGISVSPMVYQSSFASMFNKYLLYLVLAGIVVVAICSAVQFYFSKKKKTEDMRKNTRFNKIITKL